MKSLLLFLLFLSPISWSAETGTVQQIKGQRAIVIFDEGIPFSVGQKLYINSAEGTEIGNIKTTRNLLEKKNSINLSGEFSSLQEEGEDQQMIFSIAGSYAWNKTVYEFGPELTYSFVDSGSTSTFIRIGGYFDYNLKPNDGANDQIYGGVGRASFGTVSTKSGNNTNNSEIINFEVGGQAKFFMLSQVLALRTELVYRYSTVEKDSTSGIVLNLGLQHYF